MMDELKPCPFCGSIPEVTSHYSTVYEMIYGCVKCKCGVSQCGESFDTYGKNFTKEEVRKMHKEAKETAIEAWKRRVIHDKA